MIRWSENGAHLLRAVAVIAFATAASSCSSSADAPDDRLAANECQSQVTNRLNDPDSAEFTNEQVQDYGSGVFRVEGTVRSLNEFGGMTPGRYGCSVVVTNDVAEVDEVRVE
ncbi:hypothetical protein PP515_gp16 [Gordonia phage Sidious]|uniref:Lipoprotein n=1 Tax=Gordonia phage Sidious TaxID=2591118 RepID=A0A515MI67_9CAUD|nr:hypothetical protein PP515_gp16 [Gordonia phage Sidious]QDM56363.1 hypothetical protein SEA_SIDIOUS_16 [Gordonia phage Sidious]